MQYFDLVATLVCSLVASWMVVGPLFENWSETRSEAVEKPVDARALLFQRLEELELEYQQGKIEQDTYAQERARLFGLIVELEKQHATI